MTNLRIPSLQHLARNWHPDSTRIRKELVQLARNSPTFNYNPLFGAVHDMLLFEQPYEEIVEGMRRTINRDYVLDNYLGILPLIRDCFGEISPSFVQGVERRYYPIGRGLMVPFHPPMIYGADGQIHFPWFSFWRANPISGERLSLFVTMVEEVLLQDPDLESARFRILDFSAPKAKAPRELNIIDTSDVARVSEERKTEMLEIFAEGFSLAQNELKTGTTAGGTAKPKDDSAPADHGGLFDHLD